jgi:hypothetical protein
MTKWCGVPGPKKIWRTAQRTCLGHQLRKLNRAGLPRVRKATGSMVHIEARGGWSMVHGHNSQWLIRVWRYVYDLIKRYMIYIIHVYSSKSYMIQICMYTIHTHIYGSHICIHMYVQLHVALTISPRAPLHNIYLLRSISVVWLSEQLTRSNQGEWSEWIWWSQDSISGQWFSGGRKECDKCAGAELRPSTWGLDVHRW